MSTASGWPEDIERLIAAAGYAVPAPAAAPTRASSWLPPGHAHTPAPLTPCRRRRPVRTLAKVAAWTVVGIASFYGFCMLLIVTGGFAVAPLTFVFLAIRSYRQRRRLRDAEHAAAVKGVRKLHSKIRRASRRP